jgi:3-dehydroquinate dehydratase II
MNIFVIHGPNLNLLGTREVDIYGDLSLSDLNTQMVNFGEAMDISLDFYQSNNEGDIISKIQEIASTHDGLIINPAAYTHTSIGIRDAISGTGIKTIEVHMSNIHAREEFRKQSYTSEVCLGQISGFGITSYLIALQALVLNQA